MSETIPIAAGSLAESMMLPLFAKAYCAQRFGELFPDPAATQAVAQAEYDFNRFHFKDLGVLPDALRNRIMTDQIRDFLEYRPQGTVVDLDAFDDTFFPTVDNGTCRWINVARPEIIEARNSLMPPRERQTDIGCSIFDPTWFDQVKALPHEGILFIANGVFAPFKPEAVQLLVSSLAQEFPGALLCFDAISGGNMKRANKAARKMGGAQLRFSLDSVDDVYDWSPCIIEAADVSQVPGDIMGSKALSLGTRMMLFSGGSAGMTKVARLQFRRAQ